MDRLAMVLFRSLLQETVSLHEIGSIAAIDASGFDRVAASRRYATRPNYRFQSLENDTSRGLLNRRNRQRTLHNHQAI
jgi:hypothetical protein